VDVVGKGKCDAGNGFDLSSVKVYGLFLLVFFGTKEEVRTSSKDLDAAKIHGSHRAEHRFFVFRRFPQDILGET
jgi:hypothetical protein